MGNPCCHAGKTSRDKGVNHLDVCERNTLGRSQFQRPWDGDILGKLEERPGAVSIGMEWTEWIMGASQAAQ